LFFFFCSSESNIYIGKEEEERDKKMGRYIKRGFYHPISFMAEQPVSYACLIIPIAIIIGAPFRYQIASYWERQNQSPQAQIRGQAIRFYQELERMHRRQAVMNHPLMDDNPSIRTQVYAMNQSLMTGNPMAEEAYFYAHQRDVQRAQILLGEIRELKAKIAATPPAASAAA
jgi:hypothetical protein